MSTAVRVRFAPSPTGFLHLGSIRSALFNYLWARHTGGTFILRLEDTDRERLVPGAAEAISASLEWLGISPDEGLMSDGSQQGDCGPYVQSERLEIYDRYAKILLEKGALYPCWCSSERLENLRREAQLNHTAFKYDRHCQKPGNQRELSEPHVLRFCIPDNRGEITWHDVVRGPVSFEAKDLDDFVAIKSDGFPTYHFAVVVDDHLMQISHVLRGDEWVPSTPKHILLYEAFNWSPPEWVHVPQVLGPDKAKLSKRHGAKPALDYRTSGYLPAAVVNFLASLGWNEGEGSTKEIYTLIELTKAFTLDRIQRSPAVFDSERLDWLNGVYIRDLSLEQLLPLCHDFWPPGAVEQASSSYLMAVLRLVHDRLKQLSELNELTAFFFEDPAIDPALLTKQLDSQEAHNALQTATASLSQLKANWGTESLETALRADIAALNLKPGQYFGLLRVATTGRIAAPGLFETMTTLGFDTTMRRLQAAQAYVRL